MEDAPYVLTTAICKCWRGAGGHASIWSLTLYIRVEDKATEFSFFFLVRNWRPFVTPPSLTCPRPLLLFWSQVPAHRHPPHPPPSPPPLGSHVLLFTVSCPSDLSNLTIREVTALCTSASSNWICCRNSGLENFIFAPPRLMRVCACVRVRARESAHVQSRHILFLPDWSILLHLAVFSASLQTSAPLHFGPPRSQFSLSLAMRCSQWLGRGCSHSFLFLYLHLEHFFGGAFLKIKRIRCIVLWKLKRWI